MSKDSKSKQFGLKDIDLQLLQAMANQAQQAQFNILNYIAVDRFAYDVTPNTQFSVDPKAKTLTISEREEEKPSEPITT